MTFLILDTYYEAFLKNFYRRQAGRMPLGYSALRDKLLKECFGTADFYSYNLRQLGHDAQDLIVNDQVLQRRWLSETAFKRLTLLIQSILWRERRIEKIAQMQIKQVRPDVLYIQNLGIFPPQILLNWKRYTRFLVGQIAYEWPPFDNLRPYDLLLSSIPNMVTTFRKQSLNAEYLKLGFDARILTKIKKSSPKHDVVFIGGFAAVHRERIRTLELIAQRIPSFKVWGYGIDNLPQDSRLRSCYQGEAWGIEMYEIIANAKVSFNAHARFRTLSPRYANNMRMFETTGVGTMLMTDDKENIEDFFKPGDEIVTYRTAKEACEKISYYLRNDRERQRIAANGQKRTLSEHTYAIRMKELVEIIERHMETRR